MLLNCYFSFAFLQKAGLMREDAARDRMRGFGFHEHVISESIKELLEVCSLVLGSPFFRC